MPFRKIKVLIVDNSATVRQALVDVLSNDGAIAVIGTAADPFAAARIMQEAVPDVLILDVEMPRMDGITFLRKLMAQHPLPVVMCSSLSEDGSARLTQAMEAGAVDIIQKPRHDTRQFLLQSRARVCDAVKAAAARIVQSPARKGFGPVPRKNTADVIMPPPGPRPIARTAERVVCIGASTGGTESLRSVLEVLPPDCPGIVVVQHMPEHFTKAFAERLDSLCALAVKEAEDGDPVLRGHVLIAPGNYHTLLQRSGSRYYVTVRNGPLVSRHRPSVDVLFRSAAHYAGVNALGIIMTGMGDDGARGLLEMRQAGAGTIAQDEASCVVFGMPREAIDLGAALKIVPLSALAAEIVRIEDRKSP